MKVLIDHNLNPTVNLDEIFNFLKESLSESNYTVKKFGILFGKSILIGESFNVGVRVFFKKTHIEIHPSFGSFKALLLGGGILLLSMFKIEQKKKLQEQVYELLNNKFG